ncbi:MULTISPECIES: hypothetical protein [Deinococcus]|uniref:PIN domain-containing protein n=1 Tax=Deinococcus rufus TaxID=2136097 RepID=A0ABV7ZAK6_9DEIO|nr:hypothetical protein [Deinococcus sp. AB2017081]WQE94663.1 hypothetical protein U2P90_14805 [Deinococcus sp. AB2017081]
MTPWFLDACSLINLYASGRLADVARHVQGPLLIVPKVVEEAGWVFERVGLERGERRPIDLRPHSDAGVVQVVRLTHTAHLAFLDLAHRIDDGEAMTIAAALAWEGAGVVTDDEAARRLLDGLDMPVSTTSLSLLRTALIGCVRNDLRETLINVTVCGRYLPSPRHPEWEWWNDVSSG